MASFIYFNLLLGFLVSLLLITNALIIISYRKINRNIFSFNANKIEKGLAYFKDRLTKKELYISFYPLFDLCHNTYNIICFLWGFISIFSYVYGYLGYYCFYLILLDYFVLFYFNKSIFLIIKTYKDMFSLLVVNLTLINVLSLNITNYMGFSLALLIIILIFTKIYINIINKTFKVKYPILFSLLDLCLNVLLTICVSLVLMLPHGKDSQQGRSSGRPGKPGGPSGPGGPPSNETKYWKPRKGRKVKNKEQAPKITEMVWKEENEYLTSTEHSYYRARQLVVNRYLEWLKENIHGKPRSPELDEKLRLQTIKMQSVFENWQTMDKRLFPHIDRTFVRNLDDISKGELLRIARSRISDWN